MQTKSLPTEWTKHLQTQSEKENFEATVRNSQLALSQLKVILEDKIKTVHQTELREANYTDPAWAYLQAHRNGKIEGLTKALELLSFLK